MNKKLAITIALTTLFLVVLLGVIAAFRSDLKTDSTNDQVAAPTSFPINRGVNGNGIKTTYGNRRLEEEQTRLLQIKSLTSKQLESMQKLRDLIRSKPIENNDFAISYSEDLDQFFIQLKSADATRKIEDFLAQDRDLLSIYKNDSYDYFKTGTASPQIVMAQEQQALDDYRAKKYEAKEEANSAVTTTVTPSISYSQQRNQNQTKAFNNLVQTLFSFKTIIPTPSSEKTLPLLLLPIGSVLPNTDPGSNQQQPSDQSTPSNLDALFTEAGQRVGTPPPLIKAVMAHECGVLLSETTANILAWSKPGAGLPPTHKCFDGGTTRGDGLDLGPMQFWIPRYFEPYSQSVNQFGKYNRPKPYVENIVDSVYASAYKLKLDSKSPDSNFSCLEVKRASWCYACGCRRYDNGNLGDRGCRHAPGLFQYLWGYYTEGRPATNNPPC